MELRGTLTVTPASDQVQFSYVVRNQAEEPVDLTFTSGQTADVVVQADDEEVWRWSEGQMFTQTIETRTLDPGASITTELTWEDPVPGSYTAEATLAARERTAPTAAAFQVD